MNIINSFKTCRKNLHHYPIDKKQCPECKKQSDIKWSANNKNKKKETLKNWKKKNAKRDRELQLRWREENKEKYLASKRKYQKRNPAKTNAITAKRRAAKKCATVSWANTAKINAIYHEAILRSKKTGIKHQVDHIYPLQSGYMCGLHIETNLQILPSSVNKSKSNRTWPGQLDCQKGSVYDIFPKELTDLLNDQEN